MGLGSSDVGFGEKAMCSFLLRALVARSPEIGFPAKGLRAAAGIGGETGAAVSLGGPAGAVAVRWCRRWSCGGVPDGAWCSTLELCLIWELRADLLIDL